ncbi:hypothetical protein [Deinococcus alpinitundrae]|uniref:hypothetical protein n=1 Tax=Deinococcus alpinitundrae TaxID=468913 RepID=UPI00192A5A4E|nr:hypothetical protein [Deinococcus alpinitundrae]
MQMMPSITPSGLIRWAGLSAVVAGVIFAGIQPIHPPDVVSSVGGTTWAIITPLKTVMCLLMLIGVTGIYARQVTRVGWLGLIGYLIFGLAWAITYADVFAETVILPPLAAAAPQFVDSLLGIGAGRASPVDLGSFPTLFMLSGGLYMLGGLLLGIATFRAGILPRWAAGLMASTAFLTPAAAALPHQFQRLAAMPMGLEAS